MPRDHLVGSYAQVATFFMITFLVVVVLLGTNMLIAMMSKTFDTYWVCAHTMRMLLVRTMHTYAHHAYICTPASSHHAVLRTVLSCLHHACAACLPHTYALGRTMHTVPAGIPQPCRAAGPTSAAVHD